MVPGDVNRTTKDVVKIVSGSTDKACDEISEVYQTILSLELCKASSIKVAEAAKIVENTQRDLNISLMNELSIIFNALEIDTQEVLAAAGTKWNFHPYFPGLVGGHCISVDPFYLLHKARELGHEPQVIAAGRRVNDYMPHFIAKKLVKKLIEFDKHPGECKVLVMGITFKENVPDIRNSKVVDLVKELESFSVKVDVVDPHAGIEEVHEEYQVDLHREPQYSDYDGIILAVGHDEYKLMDKAALTALMSDDPILFDLKGTVDMNGTKDLVYWKL